jgi:hypothetical protein
MVDTNYARTVAAVLLTFLCSLPESIVPLSLHRRCAEITNRDEAIEVYVAFSCSTTSWLKQWHPCVTVMVPCCVL